MVESEPPLKHKKDCDVNDDRVPNGCGSKDLELANLSSTKLQDIDQKPLDVEKGGNIVDKADFERAIELTEYGKFHYMLLGISGFVSTAEEMDIISMSFILPSAQCDLKLDTQSKGWLNSIIFIGMMVGGYFWGSVADSLGRKKVLIVSAFMNAICIVASSFSQSYELFLVCRFLNGVALGGSGVIWSYFAEFQSKSKRGAMLSFMAAFWTLGNLFVAGLALLIIPQDIGIVTSTFIYNSWRIFLLICAIPSFIVSALLCFLPESPKFLLSQGKTEEAINIFRHIYHVNTGNQPEDYPVKHLILEDNIDEYVEDKEKTKNTIERFKGLFSTIVDNSKELFVQPILRYTLISITINFTFHIGYLGLIMWLPELFHRFDQFARVHPNESASVCQVTDFVLTLVDNNHNVCNSKVETNVFMESLITVAAALPSNVLGVLFMDRLGRKFFLIFGTLSSGLCAASMYYVTSKTQNLIVSAVFSSVITCGNIALDCLITEIFPTSLRATGVAISMVAARLGGIIGNIVIASLLDMYCPAPTFIVAALLILGGLLCLFLPNTSRQPLH